MKTSIRLDLDSRVLDELDRLSLQADMSRSDYIAMLIKRDGESTEPCQSSEVQPPGERRDA